MVNSPEKSGGSGRLRQKLIASLIFCIASCQTLEPKASRESPEVRNHLSAAYSFIDGGQAGAAMKELRPLIDRYPDDPEINNLYGLTQLALNNPTRALTHFRKAVKSEPSSTNMLNLSSALIETGNLSEAQKVLKKALQLVENPPYPYRERIHHNLGLIAERGKRLSVAEKHYRTALEENPTYYLSQLQLGRVLVATGQTARGIEQLESANRTCPACFAPVDALVAQYVKQKKPQKAFALLEAFEKNDATADADRAKSRDLRALIASLVNKKGALR